MPDVRLALCLQIHGSEAFLFEISSNAPGLVLISRWTSWIRYSPSYTYFSSTVSKNAALSQPMMCIVSPGLGSHFSLFSLGTAFRGSRTLIARPLVYSSIYCSTRLLSIYMTGSAGSYRSLLLMCLFYLQRASRQVSHDCWVVFQDHKPFLHCSRQSALQTDVASSYSAHARNGRIRVMPPLPNSPTVLP